MSLPEFAEAFRHERLLDTGFFRQLGAAFARENTVGLFLEAFENDRPRFTADEEFNPVEHMTLSELQDARQRAGLLGARSKEELEWLRQRYKQLQEIDALIENGPLGGIAAGLIAGLLDPINLVPLGWVMRGARTFGLARGLAGQGAAAGAVGMGMLEPFRYAADPFRTFGETMVDITIGAGFGASLGALAAGLTRGVSRAQRVYEAAGMPPELAASLVKAGEDAFANAARVANSVARASETPAGASTVGAVHYVNIPAIVRNVLRDEFLSVYGPKYVSKLVSFLGRSIPGFKFPGAALATSPFITARRFVYAYDDVGILSRAAMQDFDDAGLQRAYTKAKSEGFAGTYEEFRQLAEAELSSGLTVAERGTWQTNRALMDAMADELKDAMRVKVAELKRAGIVKNAEEFSEAVGQHMRFLEEPAAFNNQSPLAGNPDLLAAADEMADIWKRTIADPMLKAIKDSGIWAGTPATQEAILRELRGQYFPKVFNIEKIAADLPGFIKEMEKAIEDAVQIAQRRYDAYQQAVRSYEVYNKDLANWRKNLGKNPQGHAATFVKLVDDVLTARKDFEDIRAKIKEVTGRSADDWRRLIEERITAGDTPSSWEMQFRQDYDRAFTRYSQASTSYDNFRTAHLADLTTAAKGFEPPKAILARPQAYDGIERDKELLFGPKGSGIGLTTPAAVREEATKIASEIISGDPHMQLEFGLRAYLKARQTDINPARFLPWLETNFLRAAERYVSVLARDLPLYQTYGTIKHTDIIAKLNEEAAQLIEAAKARGDTAEAERLAKERQQAAELIEFAWAKARGTFDSPRTPGQRAAKNVAANIQSAAFMSLMGSGVLAQLGDIATAVLRYGARRVIPNLIESIKAGVTQAADGLTPAQLSKFATALEHRNQTRMRALYDIAPVEHAGAFTRGVQKLTTVFSRATLMPALNDALRKTGIRLADDLLTENIPKLLTGQKVDKELANVASIAGVNNEQLRRMADFVQKYRSQVDPNAKLWDSNLEAWFFQDPELGQAYRRLLHVTAQRMLIMPGALDSPVWSQKALGRLVVLFKRFVISSIPQMFIPWLQNPLGRKLETVMAGLIIGGTVTALRDLNRSGEIKDRNVAEWFFDAMDMSGLFSGLTEADATLDRLIPGLGVKRLLTGEDYTRMQERSWMHSGDTRRFTDLIGVAGRMGSNALSVAAMPYTIWNTGSPTEYQIRATRELLPFQNHFLLRHGFDILEQAAGGRERSVVLNNLGGR